MTDAFFPYAFDRRFKPFLQAFGVRPERDGVRLTATDLVATFGRLRLTTPLANVEGAHVTERYAWFKAVGARLSFVDDGLTFGTNADRGVCIHFGERVTAVIGPRRHSALTVTVEDCEGLRGAIEQLPR